MATSTRLDLDFITTAEEPCTCECSHRSPQGERACGREASFRVSVICAVEGCEHAAAVYLACARCLRSWQAQADADPTHPRLRVRPL